MTVSALPWARFDDVTVIWGDAGAASSRTGEQARQADCQSRGVSLTWLGGSDRVRFYRLGASHPGRPPP